MFFKTLYSLLAGIFLTLFIGIGIETFYPQPLYTPPAPCVTPSPIGKTPAQIDIDKCNKAQEMLQDQQARYIEIISSIALVAAVIYFLISMTLASKAQVFSYTFLFGSIFTLLFSVTKGLSVNQDTFRFTLISISLLLVFGIGYMRFVRQKTG